MSPMQAPTLAPGMAPPASGQKPASSVDLPDPAQTDTIVQNGALFCITSTEWSWKFARAKQICMLNYQAADLPHVKSLTCQT